MLTIASCSDVAAGKLPPVREYELGMGNAGEPMTAPGAEIAWHSDELAALLVFLPCQAEEEVP